MLSFVSFSCISLSLLPFIHHSPLSPFIHPSPVALLSTPLSLPIHAFTHSSALFTCYLIHPLTQPLSFTHVPIVFTRLTHPLIQPCTDSHIHTSTFSHSLIYLVNLYNQYTHSFIYSINYSFGHLTIFLNHHFIHSLYHLFPWPYNHSLNHQFVHLHFHFTEIHSFIPSFTPLTRHSLISSFPLRCRLDVLLAFYLDKGSCAELAEVGLEALQYPGRV